jgi:hypothetical protein
MILCTVVDGKFTVELSMMADYISLQDHVMLPYIAWLL